MEGMLPTIIVQDVIISQLTDVTQCFNAKTIDTQKGMFKWNLESEN